MFLAEPTARRRSPQRLYMWRGSSHEFYSRVKEPFEHGCRQAAITTSIIVKVMMVFNVRKSLKYGGEGEGASGIQRGSA